MKLAAARRLVLEEAKQDENKLKGEEAHSKMIIEE
jgi:hypothetical protein